MDLVHMTIISSFWSHPVGVVPPQVPSQLTSFWVQLHNLPADFMSRVVGQLLGNYIGEFLDYDYTNNTGF